MKMFNYFVMMILLLVSIDGAFAVDAQNGYVLYSVPHCEGNVTVKVIGNVSQLYLEGCKFNDVDIWQCSCTAKSTNISVRSSQSVNATYSFIVQYYLKMYNSSPSAVVYNRVNKRIINLNDILISSYVKVKPIVAPIQDNSMDLMTEFFFAVGALIIIVISVICVIAVKRLLQKPEEHYFKRGK